MQYMKLFGPDKSEIEYKNINHKYIQKIAESLLQTYVLVVNDKEYRLAEIEFYINSKSHPDKYTHSDPDQKTFSKWYFHKRGGSYKSGTFKGLDITLGNENTYFGVLIRSIYDASDDTMIEGPCKSVNKILELNDCTNIKEYMGGRQDPLNARCTNNFYLKRKPSLNKEIIYMGPRIGLSDKYPKWKDVQYRFLIKKNMIKKGKKSLVLIK
jgi:3-methyladenine DNA glycosylase Mpg